MYNINGLNIHVTEWFQEERSEDKPSLIFLHDSFGCVDLWKDYPKRLGFQIPLHVLVYDRTGYGKSYPYKNNTRENNYQELEADFLIDLMNYFKIKKVILFGHSDGATIALLAGAKYPNRIIGIISEAAHVFVEDITVNGIEEAVKAYKVTDLKERLEKYHGDKTEILFNLWASTWTSEKFRHWNMIDLLERIICSVLIIQGEKDEYGSIEQVNLIEKNISGPTEKLIIPGIGHTPHKEATELVFEESVKFINSL